MQPIETMIILTIIFLLIYFPGYPLWLWWQGRGPAHAPASSMQAQTAQKISFVLPVFNEAAYLQAKLQNLMRIDLPGRDIEIVLVLDGCKDNSKAIAAAWQANPRIKLVELPQRSGKPAAINAGVCAASGQIIVFCDARQQISSDAVHHLLGHLHDPKIGLVAGCLEPLATPESGNHLLRRYINQLKVRESQAGWVAGAYGPLYAVRRTQFQPLPENQILDDLVLPVTIAAQGLRTVFEPRAKVYEPRQFTGAHQFRRTSRIVRGLIQATPFVLRARIPWQFKTMFLMHKIYRLLLLVVGTLGFLGLLLTQSFLAIGAVVGLGLGFLFAGSIRFWMIHLFATGFSLFAWPFLKASVLWKK